MHRVNYGFSEGAEGNMNSGRTVLLSSGEAHAHIQYSKSPFESHPQAVGKRYVHVFAWDAEEYESERKAAADLRFRGYKLRVRHPRLRKGEDRSGCVYSSGISVTLSRSQLEYEYNMGRFGFKQRDLVE